MLDTDNHVSQRTWINHFLLTLMVSGFFIIFVMLHGWQWSHKRFSRSSNDPIWDFSFNGDKLQRKQRTSLHSRNSVKIPLWLDASWHLKPHPRAVCDELKVKSPVMVVVPPQHRVKFCKSSPKKNVPQHTLLEFIGAELIFTTQWDWLHPKIGVQVIFLQPMELLLEPVRIAIALEWPIHTILDEIQALKKNKTEFGLPMTFKKTIKMKWLFLLANYND